MNNPNTAKSFSDGLRIVKNNDPKIILLNRFTINNAGKNNEEIFTEMYNRYNNDLKKYVRVLDKTGGASPEDIVHEIFLRMWMSRSRWSEINSIESYLYKSVKNQFIGEGFQMKTQKRDRKNARISKSFENTTEEMFFSKEAYRIYLQAVARLPFRARQAYELSEFGSLENKTIASVMDISLSSVKNHMVLARKKIMVFMAERYN